jgi:predicted ATP-dependent serine protease
MNAAEERFFSHHDRGRIIALSGPPGSGKTAAALRLARRAQERHELILFIDADHSLSPYALDAAALDPNRFLLLRPRRLREAFDAALAVCRQPLPALVIFDTVNSLAAPSGDRLTQLRCGFRRLIGAAYGGDTTIVCLDPKTEGGVAHSATLNALAAARFHLCGEPPQSVRWQLIADHNPPKKEL